MGFFVSKIKSRPYTVHIGLVGKYVALHDAYLSVAEAMRHAGYHYNTHIKIHKKPIVKGSLNKAAFNDRLFQVKRARSRQKYPIIVVIAIKI